MVGTNSSPFTCLTNPQTLTSIQFPEGSYSIGRMSFRNDAGIIEITGTIDLSNCTFLGDTAFGHCSGITGTVNLSSCTNLENAVFDYCNNITSVGLGNGITTIPNNCFRECRKLKSINLSNITSILKKGFEHCEALENVDLSKCTSIGQQAFGYCYSLQGTINLSKCTEIGPGAFMQCTGVTAFTFGDDLVKINNIAFSSVSDNVTFLFSKNPNSITYDGNPFKNNAQAIWNGTTYTWNSSANQWQ